MDPTSTSKKFWIRLKIQFQSFKIAWAPASDVGSTALLKTNFNDPKKQNQ